MSMKFFIKNTGFQAFFAVNILTYGLIKMDLALKQLEKQNIFELVRTFSIQ